MRAWTWWGCKRRIRRRNISGGGGVEDMKKETDMED